MSILTVRHITTYRYARPVAFGEHRMMFRPRDSYDQRLLSSSLKISPKPASLRWLHDVFGNCIAVASFDAQSSELRFESNLRVDHQPSEAPDYEIEGYARSFPFDYPREELPDLAPAMARQRPDPGQAVAAWTRRFLKKGRPTRTGALLMTLTCAIQESFVYERRTQSGTRDPARTLELGRGSCRDFALLMMEAVRSLGLAARFVSGYLQAADRDAAQRIGDGSTHAWCQVYLPGAGWVEFDPTNGIVGNHDLIRVAVARDPAQAIPLYGTFIGSPTDDIGMTVSVRVRKAGVSEHERSVGAEHPSVVVKAG